MSVPVFACNTHITERVLHPGYTNVKRVLRLAERSASRIRSIQKHPGASGCADVHLLHQRVLPADTVGQHLFDGADVVVGVVRA